MTATYAGDDESGGTDAHCTEVMNLLGRDGGVSPPDAGLNEGCAWSVSESKIWRITSGVTTAAGAHADLQRACACSLPECNIDYDCGDGNWCDNGSCKTCGAYDEHCGSSCDDCTGMSCDYGNCVDNIKECKPDGTGCVDCVSASDCDTANGYVCDESYQCVTCQPGVKGPEIFDGSYFI